MADHLVSVKAKKAKKIVSTRTYKDTPERLEKFIESYTNTGLMLESFAFAGIHHSVHYRRMQSDPVYREAFEAAEHHASQQLEDKAFELALEGDTAMIQFLLKRFRPNLYRERVSTDISMTVNLAERIEAGRRRVLEMQQHDNGNIA